jgi:DNA-binding LacI/PurR family transcriptional regulator
VTDVLHERGLELVERENLAGTVPSFDDLIASDVDAVAIFTQRWTHGPLVVRALRAGKHVYSAVPMAMTEDEIAAIIEAVRETGLTYMMGETSYYNQLEQLAGRLVDGIFLCSTVFEPDLRNLDIAGIPIVMLNNRAGIPSRDSVGVDLLHGAHLAVEHLAEHGYDEIGIVMGGTAGDAEDGREAGWRKSLERLSLAPGPIARGLFTPGGGYQAMQRLIRSGAVPRSLFVSSDQMSRGVLKATLEAGLKVPEDVAIVSFDGSIDAAYSWPTLTTVAQPLAEMAEAAVDALLSPPHDPVHRVVEAHLVVGRSCGC